MRHPKAYDWELQTFISFPEGHVTYHFVGFQHSDSQQPPSPAKPIEHLENRATP